MEAAAEEGVARRRAHYDRARSLRAAGGFRAAVRKAIGRATNNPTSAGFLVGRRTRKIMLEPMTTG